MNKLVTELKPETEVTPDPLALLRAPFPPNQVSRLPKPTKAQTEAVKADFKKGIRCKDCGAWHHPEVVHLDYVGHAALTDRLLDADPMWSWEPCAFGPDGLPAFDKIGGLWIKLTVSGVTRLGYGNADPKPNQDAGAREKEVIGDALRNAAMRFGAALDLWHKGDLHAHEEEPVASMEERAIAHLRACAVEKSTFADAWNKNKGPWKEAMEGPAYARVVNEMKRLAAAFPKDERPPPEPPAADDFGIGDDQIPF